MSDNPTIRIYGPIGGDSEDSVTTKSVSDQLLAIGKSVTDIDVPINSDGGSVRQGLAISKMLVDHPAKIHTIIEGAACSIAGFIAMAGDRRTICSDSLFHYHGPRIYTDEALDADALEDHSKHIAIATEAMAERYATVSGQTVESIKSSFARDNFLDADEAVAAGFMTHVGESSPMVAKIDEKKLPIPKRFASVLAVKTPEPQPKPGEEPMSKTPASITEMESRLAGASADFLLKHHKKQSTLEDATSDYISEIVAENKLLANSNQQLKEQMEAMDGDDIDLEANETSEETIARLKAELEESKKANATDEDDDVLAEDDEDDALAADEDDYEAMDEDDDVQAELASLRATIARLKGKRGKKKKSKRTGIQAVNASRSGRSPSRPKSVIARVDAEAKKLMDSTPGLRVHEAKAQVFRGNEKLREAYAREFSQK